VADSYCGEASLAGLVTANSGFMVFWQSYMVILFEICRSCTKSFCGLTYLSRVWQCVA
jgi:hypothetical protein